MSHKNRDPELRKNLDIICSKFKKGQFLNCLDFEALGLGVGTEGTKYAIRLLKTEYELDILTVCRGKAIVGWILSEEIL